MIEVDVTSPVIEILNQYGYYDIERMIIRGEKYLVVTKEEV